MTATPSQIGRAAKRTAVVRQAKHEAGERAQLDVFSPPAMPRRRPVVDARTIRESFEAFHAENPGVYEELEARAVALHRVGATRIGIKAIMEAMRYDRAIKTTGDVYRLNNNHAPHYARLLIKRRPELRPIIQTREIRSE